MPESQDFLIFSEGGYVVFVDKIKGPLKVFRLNVATGNWDTISATPVGAKRPAVAAVPDPPPKADKATKGKGGKKK